MKYNPYRTRFIMDGRVDGKIQEVDILFRPSENPITVNVRYYNGPNDVKEVKAKLVGIDIVNEKNYFDFSETTWTYFILESIIKDDLDESI